MPGVVKHKCQHHPRLLFRRHEAVASSLSIYLAATSHGNNILNWDIFKVTVSFSAMNVEANRVIGQCLRDVRVRQGRTQGQLAASLGRPQSFVSKIESGERSLHFSEVFEYAEALGVSSENLVCEIASALT